MRPLRHAAEMQILTSRTPAATAAYLNNALQPTAQLARLTWFVFLSHRLNPVVRIQRCWPPAGRTNRILGCALAEAFTPQNAAYGSNHRSTQIHTDISQQSICVHPRPSVVQTVIFESTVISYLAANPSRDVIVLANQQMTAEWWQTAEAKFDLFASQLVVFEAGAGDPSAAARRLKFLADVQLLDATVEAERLTESLLNAGIVPRKAAADAAHIAFAGTHGVEYLVT